MTQSERVAPPQAALWRYRAYGLLMASVLELPGIPCCDDVAANPDVTIAWGRVERGRVDPLAAEAYFESAAMEFVLDIEGTARFHASNGCEIRIDLSPGAAMERVRLFLLGSVFGALLYQRGLLLLHGSAVETARGAMVFVGPQGEGKSTLAAHLHRRGYRLLSDDVCAVAQDETHGLRLIPALPQMRLCTDALEHLEGYGSHAEQATFDVDKYLVSLRQSPVLEPRPLGGLYLLASDAEADISLRPLRGFERLHHLMLNLYRPEYLRGLDSRGEVMQVASAIAGAVDFSELCRPRDVNRMDELLDLLESQWRDNHTESECNI